MKRNLVDSVCGFYDVDNPQERLRIAAMGLLDEYVRPPVEQILLPSFTAPQGATRLTGQDLSSGEWADVCTQIAQSSGSLEHFGDIPLVRAFTDMLSTKFANKLDKYGTVLFYTAYVKHNFGTDVEGQMRVYAELFHNLGVTVDSRAVVSQIDSYISQYLVPCADRNTPVASVLKTIDALVPDAAPLVIDSDDETEVGEDLSEPVVVLSTTVVEAAAPVVPAPVVPARRTVSAQIGFPAPISSAADSFVDIIESFRDRAGLPAVVCDARVAQFLLLCSMPKCARQTEAAKFLVKRMDLRPYHFEHADVILKQHRVLTSSTWQRVCEAVPGLLSLGPDCAFVTAATKDLDIHFVNNAARVKAALAMTQPNARSMLSALNETLSGREHRIVTRALREFYANQPLNEICAMVDTLILS